MKYLYIFFLASAVLFHSCGDKTEKATMKPIRNENGISIKKNEGTTHLPEKSGSYSIKVWQIDSIQYHSQKEKVNYTNVAIKKITDVETVKNMLKGIVFFNDTEEAGDMQNKLRIRSRNGKEINPNDYLGFIAYYPSEDILLCEGGHTIDVSFNLKNGKETEEVGNPEYFETSPNKSFRLNGHYGGHQCSSYFIQKNTNKEFQKIIQLDELFEEQTKIWLCVIGDSFWQSDLTLSLTEESDYSENGLNKRYFKIKIIEK